MIVNFSNEKFLVKFNDISIIILYDLFIIVEQFMKCNYILLSDCIFGCDFFLCVFSSVSFFLFLAIIFLFILPVNPQ